MSFHLIVIFWLVSCTVFAGIIYVIYNQKTASKEMSQKKVGSATLTVGKLKEILANEDDNAVISLLEYDGDSAYDVNTFMIYKDKDNDLLVAPNDSVFNLKEEYKVLWG